MSRFIRRTRTGLLCAATRHAAGFRDTRAYRRAGIYKRTGFSSGARAISMTSAAIRTGHPTQGMPLTQSLLLSESAFPSALITDKNALLNAQFNAQTAESRIGPIADLC
jgi:hypothetical protein